MQKTMLIKYTNKVSYMHFVFVSLPQRCDLAVHVYLCTVCMSMSLLWTLNPIEMHTLTVYFGKNSIVYPWAHMFPSGIKGLIRR